MTYFKNSNFTKRNYECTNLVVCEAESAPADYWVECDESEKNGLELLYREFANGESVAYYGYL